MEPDTMTELASEQFLILGFRLVSISRMVSRSLQRREFPFVGLLKSCFGSSQEILTKQTCARAVSTYGPNGLMKNILQSLADELETSDLSTGIFGVLSGETTLIATASIRLRDSFIRYKQIRIHAV